MNLQVFSYVFGWVFGVGCGLVATAIVALLAIFVGAVLFGLLAVKKKQR